MNELTRIFKHSDFGTVRTIFIDNEPYFIGIDVAAALGYASPIEAIRYHIDEEDKLSHKVYDSGQGRYMWLINECGLYSLIFGSNLDSAKRFKYWIVHTVLPALRKTGTYSLSKEQRNKLDFANYIESTDDTIDVGEMAKILSNKRSNFVIGRNELFEWLRAKGYLMSSERHFNEPYQRYVNCDYFRLKEDFIIADNKVKIIRKTVITGKGQSHIARHIISEHISKMIKFRKLF